MKTKVDQSIIEAQAVLSEAEVACPDWAAWSQDWLSGFDRTAESAWRAANVTSRVRTTSRSQEYALEAAHWAALAAMEWADDYYSSALECAERAINAAKEVK